MKVSYQVRQILALFWNLIALILGWNFVKGFTKIVTEIECEGVWGELEAKNVSRDVGPTSEKIMVKVQNFEEWTLWIYRNV